MTLEQSNKEYSGLDFITDLEQRWGGRLFLTVAPSYVEQLRDITPLTYSALRKVYDFDLKEERHNTAISISGDISTDFREHLIASMPHKEESQDRIHLLADPFCRGFLLERVDTFLSNCLESEEELVIEDQLPFALEGSKAIMFRTPLILPSLTAYFEYAKSKAKDLAKQLNLTPEETAKFEEQFRLGMDRFNAYTQLAHNDHDEELHSMIQVISRITLANYLLNIKS